MRLTMSGDYSRNGDNLYAPARVSHSQGPKQPFKDDFVYWLVDFCSRSRY